MYFLADITKKVPIYVHFVEKLQTFDLRALGGSFCRKFGWGAVYTFLWPGEEFTEGNTSKKQAKKSSAKEKKIPKKVLTPGSNFLEPSESSDDDEEESDNREEAQTDDA